MSREEMVQNADDKVRRNVVLASFIGTSIEWYDFIIYGIAAALVLGPQFFPKVSETTGLLLSFATFGVGFLARPFGAAVFGHFGDRVGRKSALVASLLLMGFGTFAVGLLPTYSQIGIWAPVLLVVLRLIQGIGIGGEWGGAALMAAEFAPKEKRGFFVAWPQFGNPVGLLVANAVFFTIRSLTTAEEFAAWAWRVPFLVSIVLVIVGLLIRFRLRETPVFEKIKRDRRTRNSPVLAVLATHPWQLLLVAGAFLLNNGAFYLVTTYTLAYAKSSAGMPNATDYALAAQMFGSVALGAGVLFFSWLSDRIGRKRAILPLYLTWIIWVWPMFWLIDTGSPVALVLSITIATFLTSAYGPIGAFMLEQFDTDVRYTGVGISQQLGAIVGGGLTPLVATQLNASFGVTGVQVYVAALACISAVCVLALRDMSRKGFEEFDPVAADVSQAPVSALSSKPVG